MRGDKILWVALLINLCIAVLAGWPLLCKALVLINCIALLVCVIRVLITGEKHHG